MASADKVPNKLVNETSPYLLQHAYNPVYWYPWGEEAFTKSRAEDKPVFLSIGYSTCHWCHVMEQESFEDSQVAGFLNKHFVSIKVDREERPDIDSVYMSVCQALTGSGGWPLTILMTPEQKPFYAGTYFPKHSIYSHMGLLELLQAVMEHWRENRNALYDSADGITAALQDQRDSEKNSGELSKAIVQKAARIFHSSFDDTYGGFGKAPKFPTPHNLLFLLRYDHLEKDPYALKMVEKTLQQMFRGGIFDHIGFGFSRYSTDDQWLVPHFEKMLYDNALMTIALLETYQITKKELYKTVAEKTLEYVSRELTHPDGGFYSAQDADSEGVEGKFYVFSADEIIRLLGQNDGKAFNTHFGITEKGNFEGQNIPNLLSNQDFHRCDARIEELIPAVRRYRGGRMRLHKDDKILGSWNALMIVAYTKAYRILGKECYLDAAVCAMRFLENRLTDPNGALLISYREGTAKGQGLLDDYAFRTWALLELYEATFELDYLKKAIRKKDEMLHRFWDTENGGFYLSGKDGEKLLYRPKEQYDGAIPSGNSVAAYCLVKLAKLTGDVEVQRKATAQLESYGSSVHGYPAGYSFYLMALMLELYPSRELVCVVGEDIETEGIRRAVNELFLPEMTTLVKTPDNQGELVRIAGYSKDYLSKDLKTTFFLCQNHACSAPFHGVDHLTVMLNQAAGSHP